MENANFLEFYNEFKKLTIALTVKTADAYECNGISSDFPTATERHLNNFKSAIINSLIGAIELNLLSYLPLLDPVEKNRLKKLYTQEDQMHLHHLITAYDFMKIIMNCNHLGESILEKFREKLDVLQLKEQSLSKKVAVRPTDCLYGNLVKNINHFLRTCCHPKALLDLIDTAEHACATTNIQQLNETIKRIDLWINNAEQFAHHTCAKYSAYYRDFLKPLENSISMMKFGLTALKHCLLKTKDSFCFMAPTGEVSSINENDALCNVLENIIEFPSVNGLNILADDKTMKDETHIGITKVLKKLDEHDTLYFM